MVEDARITAVHENLKRIQAEIDESIDRYPHPEMSLAGQKRTVQVMAVTKTVDPVLVNEAITGGVDLLGENRVQEYLEKRDSYLPETPVHFIGKLQRNKVKYLMNERISMIQSVDSLHLAEEIQRQAEKSGRNMDILLEVNIGGEPSKSGVAIENIEDMLYSLSKFSRIHVKGLMTIPPQEQVENFFCKMHQFFIDIRGKNIDNINMCILSMGMSADYTLAIKHGANLVRIGSALFGIRN